MFGVLPKLSKQWMLCERGTNGSASITQFWVVLTNSQSGDLLSSAAQQMGSKPFPEVNRVSWSDAAGSIFPGGYPAWHKAPAWDFTGHWIRNDIVELSIVDEVTKKNVFQQALNTLRFLRRSREQIDWPTVTRLLWGR